MKAHGRDFCKEGQKCDSKVSDTKQGSDSGKNALQNHILNVMKNDNVDVQAFFRVGDKKQRQQSETTPKMQANQATDSYSFATDKSSPVLTRPATASFQSTFANVYNAPSTREIDSQSKIMVKPSIDPLPVSSVYLKWPKASVPTFPGSSPSTTQQPNKVRFDDEDRDFDAMFNDAKANVYGGKPMGPQVPLKQPNDFTSVWRSPLRTIYGKPSNDWKPIERMVYPILVASNVHQIPNLLSSAKPQRLQPITMPTEGEFTPRTDRWPSTIPHHSLKPKGELPSLAINRHQRGGQSLPFDEPPNLRWKPAGQNLQRPSSYGAQELPWRKETRQRSSYLSIPMWSQKLNQFQLRRTQTSNPYSP